MRMCWKLILLAVWLIGQTLGFGMTGICHESLYYAQPSAVWQQILPANCGYDALPNEAIRGYDCPAHPASAYDNPINHSTGGEKRSFEGIRPLFASTAEFLAAEDAQIAFNITRTADGKITVNYPGDDGAFIMGQVSGGNLYIMNVNVPGQISGQGMSSQLYQELVNQAGNIQSISGELDGSNKAIMQALISEGYSPQQAALMTPAAASRASAGFGAQSFDPSTGILTSTRNP